MQRHCHALHATRRCLISAPAHRAILSTLHCVEVQPLCNHPVHGRAEHDSCAGYQWLAQGVFLLVFPINLLLTTLARAAAILRCHAEPGACLPEMLGIFMIWMKGCYLVMLWLPLRGLDTWLSDGSTWHTQGADKVLVMCKDCRSLQQQGSAPPDLSNGPHSQVDGIIPDAHWSLAAFCRVRMLSMLNLPQE